MQFKKLYQRYHQINFLKKILVIQHDQSDCGAACLLTILKYYGGNSSLENLRENSGTNKEGVSLLGLHQTAVKFGFNSKGLKGELQDLVEIKHPVILHTLIDNKLEHFVVYLGTSKEKIIIGDPSEGIKLFTKEELEAIWRSKHCLELIPNKDFVKEDISKIRIKFWFVKLLRGDLNILITSVIIGMLLAILSLATALVTQKLIDDIIPSKDTSVLIKIITLLFLILFIRSILSYIRNLCLLKQNLNFSNRIINFFFKSLIFLPKKFFDSRATGDLVARLNDTSSIQQFISILVGSIAIDILMLIFSIVFIIAYNIEIGIFSILFLLIYFFIVRFQTKIASQKQKKITLSYSEVETNYINTISGITEIKYFNKQQNFCVNNNKIYTKHQSNIFNLGFYQSNLNILNGFLGRVFVISIFGFGANQVIVNNLELGEFMAVFGVSSSLLIYITRLASTIIPLNEAKIAFNRMFEFTELNSEKFLGEVGFEFESLQLNNISFCFPGRKNIFNNLSLRINLGEIISVVGENGCGKSTLTQILSRLYEPSSGNVTINETTLINQTDLKKWRTCVAVVPQSIHIFNGTVVENIAMKFDDFNHQYVVDFLNQSGMQDLFNDLPSGLNTIVGEIGINLSGGQKQLIGLARALLGNPKLLILDEVTAFMDSHKETFLLNYLKKNKKNIAVILISHRLDIARSISDEIYVFEDKKFSFSGNHEELMKTKNYYSKFWTKIDKMESMKFENHLTY